MEYWDNPEYFKQRNEELYEDKRAGKLTNAQLVQKYGISQNRILNIYKKMLSKKLEDK